MRKRDHQQLKMFSSVSLEARVPKDHPLRPLKETVERHLKTLHLKFEKMDSPIGRPGIPPERLLKALLLQAIYTIQSERSLMEHLDFNLLFRWFVGLSLDEPVWDHSTFYKNRDRMIHADIAVSFLNAVLEDARSQGILSEEPFSVDGTLLESWASLKSFRPKGEPPQDTPGGGRNPEVDFHGEKRSNQTHASTTDADARLARKGKAKEAKLFSAGHLLTENRNGLVVDAQVSPVTGTCENMTALEMLRRLPMRRPRVTVGADKGYDTTTFVAPCRRLKITPHVAQKRKGSAIDGRTTRHESYSISLRKRKRIEEVFGWMKTVGCLRKLRHRGLQKVKWIFTFAAAAYNLIRIRNLVTA